MYHSMSLKMVYLIDKPFLETSIIPDYCVILVHDQNIYEKDIIEADSEV